MENGVDVKFSIDDLSAASSPEPWDGKFLKSPILDWTLANIEQAFATPLVRITTDDAGNAFCANYIMYIARNLMRDMKKGDLAFFYHSNCKTPGIVGVMEIVQEHSPDGANPDTSRFCYMRGSHC